MNSPINPLLDFWRSFGDWGFILVILGCIGEVVAGALDKFAHKHFKKYASRWEAFEIAAGAVLIIGLAMEYHGHKKETGILDSENVELVSKARQAEKDASEAMKQAATLNAARAITEKQTEELRAQNLQLKAKQLPRRITQEKKKKFVEFLSGYPHGPVKIYLGRQDDELLDFTKHLRDCLDSAGYAVTNGPSIIPLGENSGLYRPIGDDAEPQAALFLVFGTKEPNKYEWPGIEFIATADPNMTFTKFDKNDPRAIPADIKLALEGIGITCGYVTAQGIIPVGDWGVYVRQKF